MKRMELSVSFVVFLVSFPSVTVVNVALLNKSLILPKITGKPLVTVKKPFN